MLKRFYLFLFIVGIGIFTVENAKAFTDMENTHWKLLSLGDEKVEITKESDTLYFIIREGQARGSDGCNRFFMPVEIDENTIKFEHGGSTKKMCMEGIEQSQKFLDTLNEATSWQINGDILRLNMRNEEIATFKATYF